MKIIDPYVELESEINGEEILKKIEKIGRVCYKSEDRITEESAKRFIESLLKRGHESVIEHVSLSVRIVCDRGVTHEIVRHRVASYSQESTRYCNYSKDKFDNELTFINPCFWTGDEDKDKKDIWINTMKNIEKQYLELLKIGTTPEEARSILPNKDFKTFVFYNIMDTIVQKCIEVKTGDIDYIFGKCIINNTRYHKGHRQTVYLTNRAREEFKNFGKGYILGNNINSLNPDKDVVIPGAFVGDPSLVSDYGKIKLNNRAVDLFNNCDDFDYKSLYPSIDREFNMAPNTIIGLIKPTEMNQTDSVFKVRANESFGGNFLEDLHSGNILEFCTRWFYLADYSELLKDIEYYFTYIKNPAMGLRLYNYDGSMKGIIRLNKELPEPGIVYTRKIENGLDYYIPREGFK